MPVQNNKSRGSWALLLTLTLCQIAMAQTRGSPRDVVIESNRQEMDALLLRKPITGGRDVSARMAILKQLGDDFRSLQVLNNKLMEEGTSKEPVDYKKVTNLLSEIGSRASRLRTYLALPEIEVKKEKAASLEIPEVNQFRTELSKLDKTIMRFVHNPIFQKTNVVDVQLGQRASMDLTMIIEQSGKLKKVSMRLEKLKKN